MIFIFNDKCPSGTTICYECLDRTLKMALENIGMLEGSDEIKLDGENIPPHDHTLCVPTHSSEIFQNISPNNHAVCSTPTY